MPDRNFKKDFRPPLSKKSFPVGRVGKKTASREAGFFFFSWFHFYKLNCTGGVSKKKKKIEKYGKKNSSQPFLAHPAGGQETTFYLRVALGHIGTH